MLLHFREFLIGDKNKYEFTVDQELAYANRCFVFTHHVAALFCVKLLKSVTP